MKKIFALLVLVLSICLVSGCGLFNSEKVYGQDGETILVGKVPETVINSKLFG